MYYVLYFLAGAIVAGGTPHFLKGLMGEEFPSPFGRPSSATINFLWGTLSLFVAWCLWHYAGLHRDLAHTVRYEFAFGLGLVVIGTIVSNVWPKLKARSK
jgi:hypothetical protein